MSRLRTGPMRRHAGFTLIEMLITVTILAILSRIAYVSYVSYSMRTAHADAKNALVNAAQVLERCYSQYFYYLNGTGQTPCPIVANTSITSPNGYYTITPTTLTATSYTLTAKPNSGTIVGDNKDLQCATFTLNNAGTKGYTGTAPPAPDPHSCWGTN